LAPGVVEEAISFEVKIELKEEKMYAHLDEEEEHDVGTWVLYTGVMNHMFGSHASFTKIDTGVLDIVCFNDDSMVRSEGYGTIVFMCKNDESQSLDGVYFIPRLMTNIMSVGWINESGYKIDIDTNMMKIWEPDGLLLAKVKCKANCLYLLHIKLAQPVCFTVRGQGDEVAWRWHERFGHVNTVTLRKLPREELVHGFPEIG
jgi:hypothetical protein